MSRAAVPPYDPARVSALIGAQFRRGWSSGLPHFMLALVSLQGATYLAQFIIARFVGPAAFGVVRTVEAMMSLALIVASAGLPTLLARNVAMMRTPALQGALLRRFLWISCATALIAAAILMLSAPWVVTREAKPWLIRIAPLLVPMVLARTCMSYFQGIRRVHRVSLVVACAAVIGVVLVTALVNAHALLGWIAGRYLAEGLLAIGVLAMCWRDRGSRAELPARMHARPLLREGGTVSTSLLIRSAIDNLPVLSLGWFAVGAADIGYFGLGGLLAALLMLTPGSLNSLALAPVVRALERGPGAARSLFLKLHFMSAALTIPPALAIGILLPLVLERFAPPFIPGVRLVQALLIVVPLRAATATNGGILLAAHRIGLGLRYNVITLVATLMALVVLVPRFGAAGAVTAILSGEFVTVCLFSVGAWRAVGTGTHPADLLPAPLSIPE